MLHYEWAPPRGTPGGTVFVMMHGRGSDERDMLGLAERLPEDVGLLAPRAPFEAAPWGYGPGYAWYRYLGDDRPEPDSFAESQSRLAELLAALPGILPAPPELLVLGGFSQGGTMALGHAIGAPSSIAAVLNFSGFLPRHPDVDVTPASVKGTRFFWGHGTHDPNIPFVLAEIGRAALRDADAELTTWEGPFGHWIEPAELDAAIAWVGAVRAQQDA